MVAYLDEGGARYLVKKVLDRIQPVGSLYFSTNSTSPASLFGGTWERYAQGRVMVSASDTDTDFTVGKTGGSKTHRHTVGIVTGDYWGSTLLSTGYVSGSSPDSADTGMVKYNADDEPIEGRTQFRWTSVGRGGGYIFSNHPTTKGYIEYDRFRSEGNTTKGSSLQPYVAVYIWRRTA